MGERRWRATTNKGIEDAWGAHRRLADGVGEVEEGSCYILPSFYCRRVVVVEETGGKEGHNANFNEGVCISKSYFDI